MPVTPLATTPVTPLAAMHPSYPLDVVAAVFGRLLRRHGGVRLARRDHRGPPRARARRCPRPRRAASLPARGVREVPARAGRFRPRLRRAVRRGGRGRRDGREVLAASAIRRVPADRARARRRSAGRALRRVQRACRGGRRPLRHPGGGQGLQSPQGRRRRLDDLVRRGTVGRHGRRLGPARGHLHRRRGSGRDRSGRRARREPGCRRRRVAVVGRSRIHPRVARRLRPAPRLRRRPRRRTPQRGTTEPARRGRRGVRRSAVAGRARRSAAGRRARRPPTPPETSRPGPRSSWRATRCCAACAARRGRCRAS